MLLTNTGAGGPGGGGSDIWFQDAISGGIWTGAPAGADGKSS